METTTSGWVRFAEASAAAWSNLAKDLRSEGRGESGLARDEDIPDAMPDLPEGRGSRQKLILALPGLATDAGMKTADINAAIGYNDVPNTYNTLQALQRAGLVELVAGANPQRWRLVERYRTTAPVFMRVASRLRRGEWTSYSDISIAVRGDTKASRGVGRAAATVSTFPNPHRLLLQDGSIAPSWHDAEGRGPEECRRRLEEEGVEFDDAGRAMPKYKVDWATLADRDKTEPVEE